MLEDGVDDWYELWEFVARYGYSSDSIAAAQAMLSERGISRLQPGQITGRH